MNWNQLAEVKNNELASSYFSVILTGAQASIRDKAYKVAWTHYINYSQIGHPRTVLMTQPWMPSRWGYLSQKGLHLSFSNTVAFAPFHSPAKVYKSLFYILGKVKAWLLLFYISVLGEYWVRILDTPRSSVSFLIMFAAIPTP